MAKSNYNDRRERDEEEEEALSLCDLPVKFLSKGDYLATEAEERKSVPELGEDFNFVGPSLFEMEMCVADELFFQGQILPLRRLSSDNALSGLHHYQPGREQRGWCYSSGEYYYSTSRSTSSSSNISSRSSSINSTSNTITTNYNNSNKAKSKVINHFHTHYPSPKPQIKRSNLRPATARSSTCRRQNSSLWGFFRVGLVRTPEIELKNLKLRTNKKNTSANPGCTRNSSNNNNNSRSSNSNNDISAKKIDSKSSKQKKTEGSTSILSGCKCKCSIDVVEKTVTSKSRRIVLMKSKSNGNKIEAEDMKEKLLQHNTNRTFEWLKQLSIEDNGDCL